MTYNICAVIPIKNDDQKELKSIINRVIKLKCRFIEFRFDYLKEFEKITHNLLNFIKMQASPKLCSIFTFRDHSEGGLLDIQTEVRLEIIKKMFDAQPNYIDIEILADNQILELAKDLSREKKVKLIFSYHDFQKTMTFNKSLEFFHSFEKKLKNLSYIKSKIDESAYKIIYTARKFHDNLIPLKICRFYSDKDKKIISFCMGDLGKISRIICTQVGSFLTYATLDEYVAPGQMRIEEIMNFFRLLQIN